jgi:hypothetical protein
VLRTLQVAAAQNRALEQPLQPEALFSPGEVRSNTPTMADLQREHDQQYANAYGQYPGQQQQVRWLYMLLVALFNMTIRTLAGYGLQVDNACHVLKRAHALLQFAYPMPQQSMPQHAAAGNYQLPAGMYANPFPQQQQPQPQPHSSAGAGGATPQQAPGLPLPPPLSMPASSGLGTSAGFPGPQGFNSSFSGGSMADAMPGRSSSTAGGVPLDLPRSYGFSNAAGYPAGTTLGDNLDRPSFTSGSGDLPLPSQGGASSGSSGNVGANGGWGLGAGARGANVSTLSYVMPISMNSSYKKPAKSSAGRCRLLLLHSMLQHADVVEVFVVEVFISCALYCRCRRPPQQQRQRRRSC